MDADFIPIHAFIRIQIEFLEMPGLKMTPEQIARLCGLSRALSEAALDRLASRGFLRRGHDGTFAGP
jgi:DNA-binding MarR family transcriptional regulator